MKKLTIGILAHVDAGKTTLSEGLLYAAGALRTLGRVDHGNAFLDAGGHDGNADQQGNVQQASRKLIHIRLLLLIQ